MLVRANACSNRISHDRVHLDTDAAPLQLLERALMPKGSPHGLKCPKCKRGCYREPSPWHGVIATDKLEPRITKTGMGSGSGRGFNGHRGGAKCLDCGHEWWSTHSRVKPLKRLNCGPCRRHEPTPHKPSFVGFP